MDRKLSEIPKQGREWNNPMDINQYEYLIYLIGVERLEIGSVGTLVQRLARSDCSGVLVAVERVKIRFGSCNPWGIFRN